MGKNNQYNSPTVARAIELECVALMVIFEDLFPKGATVKELTKKFSKAEGYTLASHTIQSRVNLLLKQDKVHCVGRGKYGASMFLLGPAPKPEVFPEAQPELLFNEPPLAGDELISLVMHESHHAQARHQQLLERLERIEASQKALFTALGGE